MIIYKYIDKHIIDVLKNMTLKFTPRDFLNDPFELFPFFKPNEFESYVLMSEIGEAEYNSVMLRILPNLVLNSMSSEEKDKYHEKFKSDVNPFKERGSNDWIDKYFKCLIPGFIDILNNTFGILSLTEDPLSIVMW